MQGKCPTCCTLSPAQAMMDPDINLKKRHSYYWLAWARNISLAILLQSCGGVAGMGVSWEQEWEMAIPIITITNSSSDSYLPPNPWSGHRTFSCWRLRLPFYVPRGRLRVWAYQCQQGQLSMLLDSFFTEHRGKADCT